MGLSPKNRSKKKPIIFSWWEKDKSPGVEGGEGQDIPKEDGEVTEKKDTRYLASV